MTTLLEILQSRNLPELFWTHEMENEVISAMEQYIQSKLSDSEIEEMALERLPKDRFSESHRMCYVEGIKDLLKKLNQ